MLNGAVPSGMYLNGQMQFKKLYSYEPLSLYFV